MRQAVMNEEKENPQKRAFKILIIIRDLKASPAYYKDQ